MNLKPLVCAISLLCAGAFHCVAAAEPVEQINLDLSKPATPFPHFWEHMFGSGRAILSLRQSYRDHLELLKKNVDAKYVRFHNIFHDEVGVYDEDKDGKPIYNWTYVDQIYDGLLARKVRPFVELSFMPNKLAATSMPHPFWYHPNVSPPKDYAKWGEFMRAFTKHLVDRYGADEVRKWYFEVWNEPNLDFWGGKPNEATYYQLYDVTARAVKSVDAQLVVGGPATAQAAWIDRFIRHCVDGKVPVDFVSTHVYGNDSGPGVLGTDKPVPRSDMVALAVKKVHDQVAASPLPKLPIIWSEYNASYFNEVPITDSEFMGPWLATTISKCDGLMTEMSLWTFSDVFEEQGVAKSPFYGGFGLIGPTGIPKAGFHAMSMLHELGSERFPIASNSAIATRTDDGRVVVALFNYVEPGQTGQTKHFELSIAGKKIRETEIQLVDHDHASPLTAWQAMGSPTFPTQKQNAELARMVVPREIKTAHSPQPSFAMDLAPNALAVVELRLE